MDRKLFIEIAKLYRRIGSRNVAYLRPGTNVTYLLYSKTYFMFYNGNEYVITRKALKWMREAEKLIPLDDRDRISIEDLALAFEATSEVWESGDDKLCKS